MISALLLAAAVSQAVSFRTPVFNPSPLEFTCDTKTAVVLDEDVTFAVACPDAAAEKWAADKAKAWFGISPKVVRTGSVPASVTDDEGYELEAKPGEVAIRARTLQGVRYAMFTLRQAAERRTGGRTTLGYWLAALKVKDAPLPGFRFRGIHYCSEERSLLDIERLIRLAASFKLNYVILGVEGRFVSRKHPYLSDPDSWLTVDAARHLAEVAKDLGVTLIPQCQVFGHAAEWEGWGRQPVIDLHPECQSLYEPHGGFNWCLSNPEARQVGREHVAEIHEAFGNPPFVHVGLDEMEPPACPVCRAQPYPELIGRHLTEIADMLRKRGARAMIWHDMMIEKGNPKWKPLFYANGIPGMEKMSESLPKDIVICDWYYGNRGDDRGHRGESAPKAYPTIDHFRELGFDVISCPFDDMKQFKPLSEKAREAGLLGLLETTWYKKAFSLHQFTQLFANDVWGRNPSRAGRFDNADWWRQVGWDAGVKAAADTGYVGPINHDK